MQTKKQHLNPTQLRSALVDAPEEWLIAGRGTGKSEGVIAPKSARYLSYMPRATGVFVAATFQQLLTRTLPPVIAGWERLGYKQNVHYVIGRRPTPAWIKTWNWKGPYRPPLNFEHYISWWNGAGIQMISQDRIGSSNGMSVDFIGGDEAKLLNRERLTSELLPTNRGAQVAFKDVPHHHGLFFTTDMPMGTAGRWILDKKKECDPARVKHILQLQAQAQDLRAKMLGNMADSSRAKALQLLHKIQALIQHMRKGMVHYHEASTLDNIHSLGIEYIRQMSRDLNSFEFKTAILNRRPMKLEDGFYPDLDEDKHGYFAYDYHRFENTGYDLQKLKDNDGAEVDSDYDPERSLHLSLDYNRRITPAVVGQVRGMELRIIKGIHSLYPLKLNDTLAAFCNYYKAHKRRVVHFWYDRTATAEYSHAGSQSDDVIAYLRANDWIVIEHYIGKAAGHERRYTMYGHLLQELGQYAYKLRINRERAPELLFSMFQTQAVYTKKGFGKNKKTETDPNFPAEEAPHYGEALDMMLWGMLETEHGVPQDVERIAAFDPFSFM